MERIDGGNLDILFQEAFEGAELAPQPRVWEQVQRRISNERYGRRLLLWAAMISFAFAASLVFAPKFESTDREQVAQHPAQSDPVLEVAPISADHDETANVQPADEALPVTSTPATLVNTLPLVQDETQIVPQGPTFPDLLSREIVLSPAGPLLEMHQTNWQPRIIPFWKKKEETEIQRSWAQAGFETGSTLSAPSFGVQADGDVALSVDGTVEDLHYRLASTTMETNGSSFSTGVQVGTRLGRRWVMQSGLGITTSRLDGFTNALERVDGRANPVFYHPRFGGDVSYTSSIPIRNQLQFITIPVQIGYRLVDRKVGWVLLSGVNAQFLFSQKIISPFDDYKLTDSPYRSFYPELNLGTEVNYRFMDHYQLGIQAGAGVGLSPLTKPEAPFHWQPSQRSVGIFIRYVFH